MCYNSAPRVLKCYRKAEEKTHQLRFQQDGVSERLRAWNWPENRKSIYLQGMKTHVVPVSTLNI